MTAYGYIVTCTTSKGKKGNTAKISLDQAIGSPIPLIQQEPDNGQAPVFLADDSISYTFVFSKGSGGAPVPGTYATAFSLSFKGKEGWMMVSNPKGPPTVVKSNKIGRKDGPFGGKPFSLLPGGLSTAPLNVESGDGVWFFTGTVDDNLGIRYTIIDPEMQVGSGTPA